MDEDKSIYLFKKSLMAKSLFWNFFKAETIKKIFFKTKTKYFINKPEIFSSNFICFKHYQDIKKRS